VKTPFTAEELGISFAEIPETDVYTSALELAIGSACAGIRLPVWSEAFEAPANEHPPNVNYALCACQRCISSADGPYIPGMATLFIRR
jgi:hypothetical protein